MKYKSFQNQMNKLSGYRRFKAQLEALNIGDLYTVKKLGLDAKYEIQVKREGNLLLPFH